MIEQYLGTNKRKEMKIKDLKSFLLLKEDCKIEDLLEVHSFSLCLALGLFESIKLATVEDMRGRGPRKTAFLRHFQVFFSHFHNLSLFPKYKQKCLDVSLAC